MRELIKIGRQIGKTSVHCVIVDDWYRSETYRLHRSIISKRGQTRHILTVNSKIMEWLIQEQNQFGRKNPDWTICRGLVNISDRLYTILILKFGAAD